MIWSDLFLELGRLYQSLPAPDILILHLSGIDLGKVRSLDLIFTIRDDLVRFHLSSPIRYLFFRDNP